MLWTQADLNGWAASGLAWRMLGAGLLILGMLAPLPAVSRTPGHAPHHPIHAHVVRHRRAPLIVVDPGHGGKDPGAIGLRGVKEKTVALATALQFRRQLEATHRYRIAMTRDRDVFVPLRQRVLFAQKRHAALFVSLHANYSPSPSPHGIAVYRFAYRSSDLSSALIANWENAADLTSDVPLAGGSSAVNRILSSLIRHETWDHSALLQSTMVESLATRAGMLPDPGRHAHFAVLRAADIPSVLIELGFLSNPADERHLARPHSRLLLARALAQAIDLYFQKLHDRRVIHD